MSVAAHGPVDTCSGDTRRHKIIGERRERTVETKDRLLKRGEVAKRYGCSVRTVDRMCQRGEGAEPVRIGPRMIRFWESAVERYLAGERESDVSVVAGNEAHAEDI